MKSTIGLLALLSLFLSLSCQTKEERELRQMRTEVLADLTGNLLPFWEKYAPDPAGGFYGTLLNDGSPVADSNKGLVLNARILWTFSTAYRVLGNDHYKQLADRAQEYLLTYFIDPDYGGAYWSVKADGTPADSVKQTYGIAFAIYGLSEHFRATDNRQSLDAAITLYNTLQEHVYDPENGGYIESFNRDWTLPERFGYDGAGAATKTMNTHLHVLEAFTNLYRVWPDAGLQKSLTDLVHVFYDKIIDPQTFHERLFLTMDWQNLDDIDSYGHDIELSWLLYEAVEVLQDEELIARTKAMSVNLVETQLKEGWHPDGYMQYEKHNGVMSTNIDWWPQTEAVVGFVNAWQISGNRAYADAAVRTWNWTKAHLIDHEYGGWYQGLGKDGQPNKRNPKGSMWTCPYHNARMGFEILSRIQ